MAKFDITLRVDNAVLFDAVQKMGSDFGPLGERLVSAFLSPSDVCFSDAVGMSLYGVVVQGVEELDVDKTKTGAADKEGG